MYTRTQWYTGKTRTLKNNIPNVMPFENFMTYSKYDISAIKYVTASESRRNITMYRKNMRENVKYIKTEISD